MLLSDYTFFLIKPVKISALTSSIINKDLYLTKKNVNFLTQHVTVVPDIFIF